MSATPWTDLGDGIWVRQSAAFQMNSVLLLAREHAVLVDPGVLPSEIDELAERTRASGATEVTLAFTHAHWDHVLGRAWWPTADTLAHDRFTDDLERTMQWIHQESDELAAKHGEKWPKPFERFTPRTRASGLHFLKLGPWRLVLRDAFGHSHSQLSLHLPESRVLIAADMLSDIEIPTCNVAPAIYRATLETLRPLIEGGAIETIVPGHGTIARGAGATREIFERDVRYLDALMGETGRRSVGGMPLAEIQQQLAAMPDVERHPDFSMREIHQKNIQLACEGAAAPRRS